MTTLTYPGVYVQEVSSGIRPIQTASTSTAAFVGLAEMGPTDDARRISNWTEFQKYYGSYIKDSYLALSVFQFFNNGGQQCYIVRVVRTNTAAAGQPDNGARIAEVTVTNRAGTPAAGFTFSAKNAGSWGNHLYLQIENGTLNPSNEFKISIRRQVEVDVVPKDFQDITPLEVHDNLSIDPDAPNYVEKVLNRRSNFINGQVLSGNTALQRGFHRSDNNPILPLTGRTFLVNVDYDGFQPITLPATGLNALADVATAIQTAVIALETKKLKTSTKAEAFSRFTCTVETQGTNSWLLLRSGTNAPAVGNTPAAPTNDHSSVRIQDASTDNAAAQLKLGESNGGVSADGLAVRRPAIADVIQLGDAAIAAPVTAVTPGSEGTSALNVTSFTNAFKLLDNKTDFSLLCVPGENTPPMVDAAMNYCAQRPLSDVFYIGEMYPLTDYDEPGEAEAFRKSLKVPNSYGAVYFPWLKAIDPAGRSAEPILVPPSGYIAGLYARTDSRRGVWKAPAGTEATLGGTLGVTYKLTDVEQGNLNLLNVNCIREFPAAGLVAFGARTISSDPEWRYVPVRRTAIMLRVSIYNGIQWAVFEPNDDPLHAQLRLNITSFMMTLYRQGAFQGATPSEAFFVKCDRETTTQDDIDNGVVNVLVGFAPLKPAEFVVVKISQKAGQTS